METVKRKRGRPEGQTPEVKRRMQAILDFTKDFYKREGIPPKLTEIAEGIGRPASDFPNISNLVNKLIAAKFLYRRGVFLMVVEKPPRHWFYKEVDTLTKNS